MAPVHTHSHTRPSNHRPGRRPTVPDPAGESVPEIALPPARDWRTTDDDEINRRRKRAREECFVIRNSDARFPVFSNFTVASGSGLTYAVEIRSVADRQFACSFQDFRKNGLCQGRCGHHEWCRFENHGLSQGSGHEKGRLVCANRPE